MPSSILIVGAPHHGKSYFVKTKILKGVPVNFPKDYPEHLKKGKDVIFKNGVSVTLANCNIYDSTREYGFFYKQYIPLPDFDMFKAKVKDSKNKLNIFEEATSFIDHNSVNRDIKFMLSQRYHTGNSFVFLFHSFRDIPVKILTHCDFLVIFKTGDSFDFVISKFKGYRNICDSFKRVYQSENKFYHETIKLI